MVKPSGGAVRIEALDGFALAATHVAPRSTRGVALVVNSAMAVPQTHYADFAHAAAARGFDVVTYDYRGIGGSRPMRFARSLRGLRATASDWMRLDFEGVHRWVRRELEAQHVVVVGHSFGGNALGLAPSAHCIDAGAFVAAQSGYWRHWAAPRRYLHAALWHGVSPLLPRLFGYMPGWAGIGNDVPRDVMIEWSSWCRRPGYAAEGAARAGFSAVRAPLKFLSFADDTDYAPRAAVDALVRTYDGAASEHQHIEPRAHGLARIGHFGFFRPSSQALWPLALDWLAKHTRLDRPVPAPTAGAIA
jgi:predicted alpha/beta hydrolase